jgi:hypothetical protein
MPYKVPLSFIIFIPAIGEPDISLIHIYIFAVAPLIGVVLLNSAIRKKRRQRLSLLSMLAIYGAISVWLGRKLFRGPHGRQMVCMVPRLQGAGSSTTGLSEGRLEAHGLERWGDVCAKHLCVSGFRPDSFAFGGSYDSSTR